MRPRIAEYVLVATGGSLGAVTRYVALELTAGSLTMLLVINTVGSLLLGFLLTAFAPAPHGQSGRRRRLFFGTGFLGGFTTYSALAVATVELGATWQGPVYGVGTVVLGLVAAVAGALLGQTLLAVRKGHQ